MDGAGPDLIPLMTDLVSQYGSLGVVMGTTLYYLIKIKEKLDRLLEINNQVFGALLSMVDKNQRTVMETKIRKGDD